MGFPFDNPLPILGCGDPGDPIDYACLFDGGQVLERDFAAEDVSAWTLSAWVKITDLEQLGPSGLSIFAVAPMGGSSPNNGTWFGYLSGQSPQGFYVLNYAYASPSIYARFDRLWRDPAAWAHICLSYSASRIAGKRYIMHVNNVQVASAFNNSSVEEFNRDVRHAIGGHVPLNGGAAISSAKAVIGAVRFVSGIALEPSEFVYRTSHDHLVPKKYGGSYGTNGFYLDFADPLDPGKDVSGNENHFTATGLTAANQVTDTPTNNCATLNPLDSGTLPLSFGNRQTINGVSVQGRTGTMLLPKTGIWCWETEIKAIGNAWGTGIIRANVAADLPNPGTRIYMYQGDKYDGGQEAYGAGWSDGDIIGTVFKSDDGALEFFKNGLSQGVAYVGIDAAEGWMIGQVQRNADRVLNSGQKPLSFAYPYGAKPLSSSYLPCPEILNPDEYTTQRVLSVAGQGVSDLPWDASAHKTLITSFRLDAGDIRVTDTVRGAGKSWQPNTVNAEITDDGITAFTANGYLVGSAAAWQGVRLDRIERADPKAGLDILVVEHVTGSSTTVSHLVGGVIDRADVVPLAGGGRRVYYRDLAAGRYLLLNDAGTGGTDAGWFTSTANTLTIGASMPSGTYSIIARRSVPQFSLHSFYVGNGSVAGAMLPMDFEPRIFEQKCYSAGSTNFTIWDTDRQTDNPVTNTLTYNLASGEGPGGNDTDLVSNGVKFRQFSPSFNTANALHVFSAYAHTPGKFARAR